MILRNNRNIERLILIFCEILIILLMDSNCKNGYAQDSSYKIHPKDLLEITFWESPEMDTQARVNNEGTIALPVIGNIEVAGLTIHELSQKIISQMGMYNKLINQVNIKVLEFGYNKVIVTGQVASPGKYYFEKIPNLWDIIMEAGGPLEDARLNEVVIVRQQEDSSMITAAVATALKNGQMHKLPKIYSGDAIHIPGDSSPFHVDTNPPPKKEFYILGAIASPGVQQYENNLNILDAIGRAGGPTADADLTEIKYIVVRSKGTNVWKINLDYYMNNSLHTAIPTITPGCTIFIPREKKISPILQSIIVTTTSAALSTVLIITLTKVFE